MSTLSTKPMMSSHSSAHALGIIGVGNMGLGMGRAALSAGFRVLGCDIDPAAIAKAQAAGVALKSSTSELAAHANTLLIAVVNAAQIDTVLADVLPSLSPAHTVLFMSTVAPKDAARCVAAVCATGAAALDAPMSGGPARAAAGELTLMLAGEPSTITAASPFTDALASRCFAVSARAGDAMRAKLLNNLLAGIHLAAGAQVLNIAANMGLDAATFLDITQAASGQSWIAGDRLSRALAGDFAPRAHLHILAKDVRLAHALLASDGYPMSMADAALARFEAGLAAGLADLDDAALTKLPLK